MSRVLLIRCDKPAYDIDGVTHIGSCAAGERFDEGANEHRARQLGWTTNPDRCPFHSSHRRKARPC